MQKSKKIVIKLTDKCNLDCLYCYNSDKEKTGKGTLKNSDFNKIINTVKALLYKEHLFYFDIAFFGGEPLLEYDLLKKAVLELKKFKGVRQFSINTNGVLLSEEIVSFFSDNNISVSVSIDGTEEMHKMYRGNSMISYENTFNGIMLLVSRNIKTACRMTIGPKNVKCLPSGIEFLLGLNIDSLGFAPAANLVWSKEDLIFWRNSINESFGRYLLKDTVSQKVHDFNSIISGTHISCNPGFSTITVCPDGSLKPCHRTDVLTDLIEISSNCLFCPAFKYCSFCTPKYGQIKLGTACMLKIILINECKMLLDDFVRSEKRGKTMGKILSIDGELFDIPEDVLEKCRLSDSARDFLVKSKKLSALNNSEPPIKGNWYELGESDCY